MDILAHGLWGYAVFHKSKFAKLGSLFAILPDIIAFGPLILFNLLLFNFNFSVNNNVSNIPDYVFSWYNVTHSFITVSLIALLSYLIVKKFPWPILGWYLHIFLDIPTHKGSFFPTPFLFPISNFHVNGITWAEPWFMLLNYSALLTVYILIFINRKKRRKKK